MIIVISSKLKLFHRTPEEEGLQKIDVSSEELAKELEKNFQPPEGWEQIDSYPVYGDYVFASVHILARDEDLLYHLHEPELSDEERKVVDEVLKKLEYIPIAPEEVTERSKEELLKEHVDKIIHDFRFDLSPDSYARVFYEILKRTVLYDRITAFMYDPYIEDVSCNGHGKAIYVFHSRYTNLRTNIIFDDPDYLDRFIVKLAQQCGKHINLAEPMVDATMPDGSRIQMTLGKEITDHGSTFTIRRFKKEPLTPINLITWGTFSPEQMAYLWLCIENKKSLIFAGGTASGKTTSMNAISLFIPKRAKIVTIEDTREIMLPHRNWIPAVTRDAFTPGAKSIDMYDLLRGALRQRPEYIIVGEVRGREAQTLFQAMSTGHTTYSTLHADSVNGAIHRLENPPINVPRAMLEALDIISIQSQTYVGDKRVRRNIEIAEIVGLDPHTKMLKTTTVFTWDGVNDEHTMVGSSKALESIRMSRGWTQRELMDELERRRIILETMSERGILKFTDVAKVIHTYQDDPERAMKLLGLDEL